ncbi:hypothetical protein C0Q70_12477 [Pomacea canaliculata]|uniref:Uncharacterized protein n=1 Tax=Pomacea canaliculata TaxID=400727 RepID=A0A2T7P1N2_POMCA|nr:hypothetical protein C0Q70_12477 [Pomacea canaliculata]
MATDRSTLVVSEVEARLWLKRGNLYESRILGDGWSVRTWLFCDLCHAFCSVPLTCALNFRIPTIKHDSLVIVKVDNSSYELSVNLTCEPWDKG